jgi:hypothetical protein
VEHRRVGGAPVRLAQADPQVGETAGEQLGAGWGERGRLAEHPDGRHQVGVAALDPGTSQEHATGIVQQGRAKRWIGGVQIGVRGDPAPGDAGRSQRLRLAGRVEPRFRRVGLGHRRADAGHDRRVDVRAAGLDDVVEPVTATAAQEGQLLAQPKLHAVVATVRRLRQVAQQDGVGLVAEQLGSGPELLAGSGERVVTQVVVEEATQASLARRRARTATGQGRAGWWSPPPGDPSTSSGSTARRRPGG